MSFTTLGIMKLLFLPWVCKPLFAPLVDSYFDKKWWLQKVCEFSSYNVNKNDLKYFVDIFVFQEYVSIGIHLSGYKYFVWRNPNWIFVNIDATS